MLTKIFKRNFEAKLSAFSAGNFVAKQRMRMRVCVVPVFDEVYIIER